MQNSLKICVFVIVPIILIGLVVAFTGVLSGKNAKSAAHKAIQPGLQQEVITAYGAEITSGLIEKPVIVLEGVELCDPKFSYFQNPYQSSFNKIHMQGVASIQVSCSGTKCITVLDFNNGVVPADLTINRRYGEKCIQQNLPNIAQYTRNKYIGSINISADVKKRLGLPASVAKAEQTKNSVKEAGISSRILNGNTIVSIDYGGFAPTEDEFMLGGSKLVKLKYPE